MPSTCENVYYRFPAGSTSSNIDCNLGLKIQKIVSELEQVQNTISELHPMSNIVDDALQELYRGSHFYMNRRRNSYYGICETMPTLREDPDS